MSRRGWVRKGDDGGTHPESYPKFTARAPNVTPAGALHLKRLLAIFMCTYVVIERERDVKAQNSEGPFQLSGDPKGPAIKHLNLYFVRRTATTRCLHKIIFNVNSFLNTLKR